jgi:hypothetical protein
MSIQTRWLNQPEQVRYRARLPLISEESLSIPSMIPMIRSTTPDVSFCPHPSRSSSSWMDRARKHQSSSLSSDLPDTPRTDAGACYVLRPAGWIESVFLPIHQNIEPSSIQDDRP